MENQSKDSANILNMNKKKEGKITLGMLKGKPVTTSVPSISIRFHANAEQIEELYASDDETTQDASTTVVSDLDSSPLKYLPRLVKRSTSIDITPTTNIDASPPSDPWRFFSDIKGKITKSVEEKITEIKSRNQEEGSPLKSKGVKDSKDNSSISDSEDLSESSISKTCGIVSTTEGAEMSSDDDTPSIEKDKKTEDRAKLTHPSSTSGLRHRFKLLKTRASPIEGTISRRGLTSLYNINTDKIEQALPEENDVESAIDALEDNNLNLNNENRNIVMEGLDQFDNIKIDNDNVINVKEVRGGEVKQISWHSRSPKTVYSPIGFVDFRERRIRINNSFFLPCLMVSFFLMSYYLIQTYSSFLAGILLGVGITSTYFCLNNMLNSSISSDEPTEGNFQDIVEVPAASEIQPVLKHEGWVNELPEVYNPHKYHISQTQSVFLRLQSNLLRMSHSKSKVPKRALWNEPKIKPGFTHHRVYNLLGAKITLLPDGLAKKRHWSKKYPICISLNTDQLSFDIPNELNLKVEDEEATPTVKPKRSAFPFHKRKRGTILSQRFSKLSEENEDYDLDSENSRGSTPSPSSHEESEDIKHLDDPQKFTEDILQDSLSKEDESECPDILEEEFETIPESGFVITKAEDYGSETTNLYIFGRTDREKEDWFRRLKAATHKVSILESSDTTLDVSNRAILEDISRREEYEKYMLIFNKLGNNVDRIISPLDNKWINFLVGRILFDCLRSVDFIEKIKEIIQRKLSSIKLPYFIEDLKVTELSLGKTPPIIHKVGKPMVDERGLWIDLDISYEGLVCLILQTKLNLMKLKHPQEAKKNVERPAMFHSDVEDSAESTSDEESMISFDPNPTVLDGSVHSVGSSGTPSSNSRKFMKMVDKITESKFFQAATEYRYIKKAMEGVSNTELRLKVDIKGLIGTLVLNIPPPPSDRVWIGFRPLPELALSAQPIVGDRNITFLRITSWIEKKLLQEFQKIMVIPNMEDLIIPVMSPDLPQ